jgi:hypothetical protein
VKKIHTLLLALLPAFAWLSVFQLAGCITVSVQGESTGQMKRMITESQFYRDAALFYPNGEVGDPEEIPPLKSENLRSLQRDLENTLKLVLRLHKAHREVLSTYFGDTAAELPQATVLVTNRDLPEAQTTSSGEIAIDVRVLQSMLRAALLTAYELEIQLHRVRTGAEFSAHRFSPEEEAIAINTFLSKRMRFDQTPSRSVIGDLTNADPLRPSDSGPLDWFEMRDLIKEFSGIAVRYDTQRLFLLAHEVGHIVLGHFGLNPLRVTDRENDPEDNCSGRRAFERAADIYAGILITWATSPNAVDDFLGLFGGTTVNKGYETFFSYAYDYAGFETADGTRVCVNYPPPAQRLAGIRRFYDNIRNRQIDAIIQAIDRGF